MARVEISADEMAATLHLAASEPLTVDAAMQLLANAGVTTGLLTEAIGRLVGSLGPCRGVVARGKRPKGQRPSMVLLDFKPGGPLESAGPRCRPGQSLARLAPGSAGQAGLSVTGRTIAPPAVPEVTLRAGRGAYLAPEGDRILAQVAGVPRLEGAVVLVRETLRLDPTALADWPTSFDGDVVIAGDVPPVALCVTGDITVSGDVVGVRLVAGGALYIAGDATGHSCLVAGRDVDVRALVDARVCCGGDLRVAGDVTRCEAEGRGEVIVGGGVAQAVVRAGARLTAAAVQVGSWLQIGETSIEVVEALSAVSLKLAVGVMQVVV